MVSRGELNRSNLGYAWGLPGRLNPGAVLLLRRICDPFLCPEKVYFTIGKFHPSQNSFGFPKTI